MAVRLALAFVAIVVSCPAICGTPASPAAGPKVLLKAHYAPGAYEMTVSWEQDRRISSTAGAAAATTARQFVAALTVGAPDAAGVQMIQMRFRRISEKIEGSGPGIGKDSYSYDSADPAGQHDPRSALPLTPLLKTLVTAKVGPDGKVTDLAGISELFDAILAANPKYAAAIGDKRREMGNEVFSNLLSNPGALMPSGPVAPGDAWDRKAVVTSPGAGPVEHRLKYRLDSLTDSPEGKVAVISASSEGQGPGSTTKGRDATITFRDVTCHTSYLMRFNLRSALAESLSITDRSNMAMEWQAGEKQTVMDIKNVIKTTMTLRREASPPAPP
jgi:hypothetical protein